MGKVVKRVENTTFGTTHKSTEIDRGVLNNPEAPHKVCDKPANGIMSLTVFIKMGFTMYSIIKEESTQRNASYVCESEHFHHLVSGTTQTPCPHYNTTAT